MAGSNMLKRQIGQSGIEASAVGLGTWGLGGWMWGGTDEKASIDAIHASLDAGVTLIDTAPAYGLGLAEELVGKALVGHRDRVVLATKCGLIWHAQQGQHFFDEHNQPVHRYLGAESIRYELEQSLRRLKTDYIDLYQTHWQDPTTPIAETMQTLLDFKKEGKIRAIGASNASLDDIQEYVRTGPLDSTQEKYSMLDREIETTLLPYCRENDIALLSYSSLALGLLTGKISPDRVFTGDDQRASDPRFSLENRQRVAAMLDRLTPIAERYTVTLPQLVIAWTMRQPGITFALCGARNGLQALENAQAGLIVLDEDDLQTIDTLLQTHTIQFT